MITITCLYGKNEPLLVPVHVSGVFCQETPLPDCRSQLEWERFIELFLSNIMKYGKMI